MGILSNLLTGGGLGEKITDLITARVENKGEAARLAAEARTLVDQHEHERAMKVLDTEAEIARNQSHTNQVEASSQNLFKSGWRPAAGWVCVTGLAYTFVARPFIVWVSEMNHLPVPPALDIKELLALLFPLLGLGAYRSYERRHGKA